ncbi:hypothetical protein K488DRAFT_58553, partial [Vararia minispora EC-137]
GAINQRRSNPPPPARFSNPRRSNSYVSSSYKPPSSSYVRPGYAPPPKSAPKAAAPVRAIPGPAATQTRDVTINGVAFETSRRSLVRKDSASVALPFDTGPTQAMLSLVATARPPPSARPQPEFSRTKNGHLIKTNRVYKPRGSRQQNLFLNNRPNQFQSVRSQDKKIDKPCPAFNTTGTCTRGLTCAYKHDPSKIAICWPFLQGTCPHTAETCTLSHDPTLERTPLCVHFANHGRCTRAGCPFPHVHVSPRTGVCRDFAVLGYCDRGVECEHQHVRECPDFAETGVCGNKRCKLPHVIRANRVRKATATSTTTVASAVTSGDKNKEAGVNNDDLALATAVASGSSSSSAISAENAQLGDEYISLTFNESEADDSSDDEDDDDDDGEDDEEDIDNGEDEDDSDLSLRA